jgi:hypothetical protein
VYASVYSEIWFCSLFFTCTLLCLAVDLSFGKGRLIDWWFDSEAICKRGLIEQVGWSGRILTSTQMVLDSNFGWDNDYPDWNFCFFTHSHRANSGILHHISPRPLSSKLFPFRRRGIRGLLLTPSLIKLQSNGSFNALMHNNVEVLFCSMHCFIWRWTDFLHLSFWVNAWLFSK